MTFELYQQKARETAQYPDIGGFGWLYPAIEISGEAGEILEKIKKLIRDKNGILDNHARMEIAKECGDVLWGVANLAWEIGFDLATIAEINIDKLSHRRVEDKISGEGDNR